MWQRCHLPARGMGRESACRGRRSYCRPSWSVGGTSVQCRACFQRLSGALCRIIHQPVFPLHGACPTIPYTGDSPWEEIKYTNDLYVILMIDLVDYFYHLDTREF